MSDMASNIAEKEIERDQLNEKYNEVVAANAKFLETATKFRETFVKVEALEEKKRRYQEELDNARENLQEIAGNASFRLSKPDRARAHAYGSGTDEELATRLQGFNDHIAKQKRQRVEFDSKRQDLEDEISDQRAAHTKKVSEHGQLAAEAKVGNAYLRNCSTTNANMHLGS